MILKLFNIIYINMNEVKYILPGDRILEIAFKDGTSRRELLPYSKSSQIAEVDSAIEQAISQTVKT